MKKGWYLPASALLVAVVLVTLFVFRSDRKATQKPEKEVASVKRTKSDTLHFPEGSPQLSMIQTKNLHSSPIPLTDTLSGRLVYDEDATARIGVGVSGRVVNIDVAPGDTVKAGQVLAEIDSPDFGAAYADLNKARADLNRKRLAVERAKELVPGEAIPIKDWEALLADFAQARAEADRAEQRVKNINPRGLPISDHRMKLTTPIGGIVVERSATPGLEVSPGMVTPIFVVTDPKRLWLMIDLPENLLGRIKKGSNVDLESDAYPGERFMAKIVQVGQVIDPNTRRVNVRAKLDNPQQKLLPEMFVRAHILQDNGDGIAVPNSALVNQGMYTYVYVQNAPLEFQRRKVKLLTQGGEVSYVSEGLRSGESVVTSGAMLLDAELSDPI